MEEKKSTPLRAIRAKCLDCSCGSVNEVKLCPITDCSLYPYRLGKNPNIKVSDARRAKLMQNLPQRIGGAAANVSGV